MTRKRKCDFISKIQLISMKFLADLQTLRVNFNYFTVNLHKIYFEFTQDIYTAETDYPHIPPHMQISGLSDHYIAQLLLLFFF